MESLLKYVQDNLIAKKDFLIFHRDTITVYYEIKEGEKSRVQFFRGVESNAVVQELLRLLPSVKCPVK